MHNLNILTLAILMISLAITPVLAKNHEPGDHQGHYGMKPGRFEQISEAISLTPQQETEIKAIFSENQQDMVARRETSRGHRKEIRALCDAEVLDEVRLQQLVEEQAELKTQNLIAQHAMRSRLKSILTPEQQEKWAALHQERRRHREARKDAEPSNDNGDR